MDGNDFTDFVFGESNGNGTIVKVVIYRTSGATAAFGGSIGKGEGGCDCFCEVSATVDDNFGDGGSVFFDYVVGGVEVELGLSVCRGRNEV